MTPETILGFLLIGLIAGALGKLLMPGKDPGGCLITMLIGIAGSFLGGFLASLIGIEGAGSFVAKLLVATAGAIVLLLLYRLIIRKKKGT